MSTRGQVSGPFDFKGLAAGVRDLLGPRCHPLVHVAPASQLAEISESRGVPTHRLVVVERKWRVGYDYYCVVARDGSLNFIEAASPSQTVGEMLTKITEMRR